MNNWENTITAVISSLEGKMTLKMFVMLQIIGVVFMWFGQLSKSSDSFCMWGAQERKSMA